MHKIFNINLLLINLFLILFLVGCKKESVVEPTSLLFILTDTSAYYPGDDLSIIINTGSGLPTDSIMTQSQPQPLNTVTPVYPETARKSNTEGDVWIKLLIMSDGSVKRGFVLQTTDIVFNKPSLTAAMQWTFTPAKVNGKNINVYVSIPFKYRLNK